MPGRGIDTNRVYATGFSQGAHAVWDLIAMRPGMFAGAGLAAGWAGSTYARVNALRRAGGNPIYTEYASGSSNPHLYGIGTGASNPAFVTWLLAQRRGVSSTSEPLLSITAATPQAVLATSATNLNLSGSAAALDRAVTRVTWTNYTNRT